MSQGEAKGEPAVIRLRVGACNNCPFNAIYRLANFCTLGAEFGDNFELISACPLTHGLKVEWPTDGKKEQ